MCCSEARKSETKQGIQVKIKIEKKKKSPTPGKYSQPACLLFTNYDSLSLFFKPASHSNHIARLQAPSYLCIIKTESIKIIHYIFLTYIISLERTFDHYKTQTLLNLKITLDPQTREVSSENEIFIQRFLNLKNGVKI